MAADCCERMDGRAVVYGVERQAVQSGYLRRHAACGWAREHQRCRWRSLSADGGKKYIAAAGHGPLRSAREPGAARDGEGADARECGDIQSGEPCELFGDYAAGVSC